MNPLLYALIGLLAGAGIAAIIVAITRRKRDEDAELIKRLELLDSLRQIEYGLCAGANADERDASEDREIGRDVE